MRRVFLGRATPQSAGGRHNWFVEPTALRRSDHARILYRILCVHITLLVTSRQLLFSAASEQVVGDTMASASLLGLVIWSVIMINFST